MNGGDSMRTTPAPVSRNDLILKPLMGVWRSMSVRLILAMWMMLACDSAIAQSQGQQFQPAGAAVVRPAVWSSALTEWKEYRGQQGIEVVEIDAELGRDAIQQRIRELASDEDLGLRFVVLAGDVQAGGAINASVPTFYHASTAMVQFGADRHLASDNDYGDLDGDHVPELAVGRIPADTPEQLRRVLHRVIEFERHGDFASWRRDVHVVAGVGGFGMLADSIIELTTRRFLADRIPGWTNLSMTQASTQSFYCPDPWRFSETCVQRLNQGGMFWVYIGHGHVHTLDAFEVDRQRLPIMTIDDVPQVQSGVKSPIVVFLACYTGAFDAAEDCLAERLVIADDGPVAAIAASRVSGPYGLAMLASGMLEGCFQRREGTLGEVMLFAKRKLLRDPLESDASGVATGRSDASEPEDSEAARKRSAGTDDPQLTLISSIADALSPEGYDLAAERLEHVWQMNLLGDPMLRLRYPELMELNLPGSAQPGQTICIEGRCLSTGELIVELGHRRGEVGQQIRQLSVDTSTLVGRENFQARYVAANTRPISTIRLTECPAGDFQCDIAIPDDLQRGTYMVRVFHQGDSGWGAGYSELKVRPRVNPTTMSGE